MVYHQRGFFHVFKWLKWSKLWCRRLPEGRRRVSQRVCDLSQVWGHGHQNLRAVPEHVSLRTASHQVSLQTVPDQASLQKVPNQVSLQKVPEQVSSVLQTLYKRQPIWRCIKESTLGKSLTVALVVLATNVTFNPFEDASRNPHRGKALQLLVDGLTKFILPSELLKNFLESLLYVLIQVILKPCRVKVIQQLHTSCWSCWFTSCWCNKALPIIFLFQGVSTREFIVTMRAAEWLFIMTSCFTVVGVSIREFLVTTRAA